MYFVLLYSAANPPLKKTRGLWVKLAFRKNSGIVIGDGSLSPSQKKNFSANLVLK